MRQLRTALFAIALSMAALAPLPELGLYMDDTKFDHVTLTQFWAPQACRSLDKHCKFTKVPSNWTIHGFWPTIGDTHDPMHCTNESFNQSLLTADMQKFMNEHWYSFEKYEENLSFWEHEWVKHGTCAVDGDKAKFPDQKSYFQITIDFYKRYNISTILTKANIRPGMTRTLSEFIDAFKSSEIGKTVRLECDSTYLLAVEICFNDDLQVIDCTSPTGCSPKRNISLAPF